ncbi:SGNH/GDSL hydrolase family protein [Nocardia yamanashiensis]|uniref:SGNH/GDSL hydrolase family protein n=1 Tax=Nocardia yamanashiensis TaxID=209247 RepID=UPI001E535FCC|nr:SGNH/GDSL hydrolase family protein [Nocardia yamanashiensis]UGT40353.1 SGNH/GDSL hydrolase family protein [Nocardia yamanashiensis]
MNLDLTAKIIRFQQPELSLPYLNGIDEAHLAALFGLEADEYRALRAELDAQVRAAAADLLTEPEFAELVDRLPFAPGARVVALGESSTADRLSWFEILRHLLELRRPDDRITLTNLAISGSTTTQVLKSSGALGFHRPDWVLCQLGGNDAQRLGPDGPRVVSADETARNFGLLRAQGGNARWAWLTPTDMDEALIAEFPPFRANGISWRAKDHEETAATLDARPEVVIDTLTVTHPTPEHRLFESDGVHLTPAGQIAVARVVVAELALLD